MTTRTNPIDRAHLGRIAMYAFWRMVYTEPEDLAKETKEQISERWQEAAAAVVEAIREGDGEPES
jgi:hypothetical protein